MRVNIGEVTFNTSLDLKILVLEIILKISVCSCYQCKKGKLLNPWNAFFQG